MFGDTSWKPGKPSYRADRTLQAYSVDSPLIIIVYGHGQLMDEWTLREGFRQIIS
jgi:hypothetical protein